MSRMIANSLSACGDVRQKYPPQGFGVFARAATVVGMREDRLDEYRKRFQEAKAARAKTRRPDSTALAEKP